MINIVWVPTLLTVLAFILPYVWLGNDRKSQWACIGYVIMLSPCLVVALIGWVVYAFVGHR
jgi:hypothetical protein